MKNPTPNILTKTGWPDIKRVGATSNLLTDFYYYLLKANWGFFLGTFIIAYMGINSFFAWLYWMGGDSILNAAPQSYWEYWLFSFQTSTTVGYGHYLPKTNYANIIVIFDSLVGILFVAIATGLAFAKFSRPSARILFSNNVLLTKWHGKRTLMFRLANGRNNQITDANLQVAVMKHDISPEGISMRRLYDVKLERSRNPIFGLSWTVYHVIDEDSPFHGLTLSEIQSNEMGLIATFSGLDSVFAQTVHGRHGYNVNAFVENKQFVDIFEEKANGVRVMNYGNFHRLKD